MLEMLGALAGLAGKGLDAAISRSNAKRNIKMQKEFAQHGIRWKVEDAKAAGLHPLAALGAQTTSFSPVSIGSDFGSAGQDISRAMQAKTTEGEKLSAVEKAQQDLQLQRSGLENQLLAAQIRKLTQPGTPPSMPSMGGTERAIDGQAQSPLTKIEPQDLVAVNPHRPGQEPGAVTDVAWTHNPDGTYSRIPSKEAKDRLEDFKIPQWQWSMRNVFIPPWNGPPGPYRAPEGHQWYNNPATGKWWLAPIRGSSRVGEFANPGIRRLQR